MLLWLSLIKFINNSIIFNINKKKREYFIAEIKFSYVWRFIMHKYKVFLKAAELQNITKTAVELGYTQSGVSYIINNLEEEFGCPLFSRNKNGIKLTPNGEKIAEMLYENVQKYDELMQELKNSKNVCSGVIRIGAPSSICMHWLPVLIKDFKEIYPDVDFRIVTGEGDEIDTKIAVGDLEVGLLPIADVKNLETIFLCKDRILCVLPVNHPLAHEKVLNIKCIENEPFILPGEKNRFYLTDILKETNTKINIKYTTPIGYGAMALVEQGLGITILPELILKRTHVNIAAIPFEEDFRRTMGIAISSWKTLPLAAKEFVKFTEQYFKDGKLY